MAFSILKGMTNPWPFFVQRKRRYERNEKKRHKQEEARRIRKNRSKKEGGS
jgi:hypothetical protein